MKYPQIQGLEDDKFRRLTGVKRITFEKMIGILKEADIKRKARGGRKKQTVHRRSTINGIGIYFVNTVNESKRSLVTDKFHLRWLDQHLRPLPSS